MDGRRGRGRPKGRWMENIMSDLKGEELREWAEWRRLVKNADPT